MDNDREFARSTVINGYVIHEAHEGHEFAKQQIEREKERVRRDFAYELFKQLDTGHHYVIQIREKWEPVLVAWNYGPDMEFTIRTRVTQCETQKIRIPEYETYGWSKLSASATAEISRRIRYKIERIRNRIRSWF